VIAHARRSTKKRHAYDQLASPFKAYLIARTSKVLQFKMSNVFALAERKNVRQKQRKYRFGRDYAHGFQRG
jgi:hypothetical protein